MAASVKNNPQNRPADSNWRNTLYTIIFEADTPAGKIFDEVLILTILLSIIVVMLDSVSNLAALYGGLFYSLEWIFTILFTVEYLLRLICVGRPLKYATSFFGIIDLMAILPTYLSLLLPGGRYLVVIRGLRLLRVFRVLKLVQYLGEAEFLIRALRASRRKIILFQFTVLTLVVILGSLMYVIEGAESGFTSIPRSIYWAIITLTTVGYGDIVPETNLGQALASFIMIIGYSIIAVPTGIVTSEMTYASRNLKGKVCQNCSFEGHDSDAKFCKRCGAEL
ncbi:ion transporter [Methanosarcina sp. 2.H.T.1A.6]|uniref:ion transporter n=1 Tax=unclassified Methanosarcina TaxID=2644672 RepID=UPI000622A7CA|nr:MULTISPECIES: ion transporter [unclassified Methanosarcina]KKG16764.1 ion transporter [Methanosarcina sp. 2.H.T.1A.3]KKG22777.1 ion transporter [Methanosarcina sp. 2.H.T.1A.6]KKG24493.1 ion transporter [Methanosarcina sp. 2.H.T.1A.8]KKG27531.1 ion transporter [Methanosarcina sp. 2.H.T.1A.15]